jgi:endogenous inhibitor of DNA gyrase (YacG/DUF329 family)
MMRQCYFIVCPKCQRQYEVREVRPYRVAEGPMGDDIVTFNCPHCQQRDVVSPIRRDP